MNIRRLIITLTISVVAAAMTGCASQAEKKAMVTPTLQVAKKSDGTVSVKTAGGAETTSADSTNISDENFKAAIEESISKNRIFKSVVQGRSSDYELLVSITRLEKPVFGLSFTVTLETTWVLVKRSDASIVMKRNITSSHTATFGDATAGVKRMRLAVEGAARKNIESGLLEIGSHAL